MNPLELDSIAHYSSLLGLKPLHPLVTVVDLAEMPADRIGRKRFGFYCVMLKEHYNGKISYGRGRYEYQAGTMIFTSPGQVIGIDVDMVIPEPKGYLLMIHPDFFINTSLARRIKDYYFFAYDVNEALQMSEQEKEIVNRLFLSIREELMTAEDTHTRSIVISYIETLLNYCLRFYDRQFEVKKTGIVDIVGRLEMVLEDYYIKDKAIESGLPTVNYCARILNLSSNYFGDRIKKETGKSAQQFIHSFVIDKAKFHLMATSMNISEVAYHLGFRYPHHFSRLFKSFTGTTPNDYRKINSM